MGKRYLRRKRITYSIRDAGPLGAITVNKPIYSVSNYHQNVVSIQF